MRTSLPSSFAKVCLIFCLAVLAVSSAFAQINGAIYTKTSDGTTVNGNIYDAKTAVYLNGGPQHTTNPGLSPTGLSTDPPPSFVSYYFQVTDPSGAQLLSADHITCRQVLVQDGRIVGVPSAAPPTTCASTTPGGAYHPLGTANNANGELPVQLCPSATRTIDNLGNGSNFDP